jgi:predicted DNA-binding ArsR family transcriptional regulator
MHVPKISPRDVRPFNGVADPAYILAELSQLHEIAQEAGYASLEYLIECAMIEARWLTDQNGTAPPAEPRQ